ncbi:MAG TPA: ISAs1 family transposase [Chloroflexota bacterium]
MSQPELPEEFALLRRHLARIADPRFARGKVHPLASVLGLAVLALMGGARSMSDISRFGKLRPEVLEELGLRRSPSVATLGRLLRLVSVEAVRENLRSFARELHEGRQGDQEMGVVALDGKVLRGTWEDDRQLRLLHVFAHRGAMALDQAQVEEGAGEIAGAEDWVRKVAAEFPGLELFTGDAIFAERTLCEAIIASDKDYLFKLKKTKGNSTGR